MKSQPNQRAVDDGSKRAKNIAAILYVLIMAFLVGGSYWHQQYDAPAKSAAENAETP